MIYMVECGFGDPVDEGEWNEWYSGPKLDQLLAVPDFLSAQRFKSLDSRPAPYLNVTTIATTKMFNSSDYRGHGGGHFGKWPVELIIDWDRRLFSGDALIPPIGDNERLLFVDRALPDIGELAGAIPTAINWLEGQDWQALAQYTDGIALDQSVRYRGFAVLPVHACAELVEREDLRLYAPICAYRDKSTID
ncbi:MAG: hypothetical protein ACI9DC_004947 [Gammaproteobacteria bacterium]|jgi:hypothetical protein